jgi:glycosyltransferase involved in cell wall biosynthesis
MTRRLLRIVRVSEYVPPSPGGREVHVRELSRRQARRGHSVRLIYRVGGESAWPFAAKRLLLGARTSSLPRPLVSALFLTRAVADVVRSRRAIDVVHFHGDYLEALAAGAVRLFGVPSLLTLHGRLSPRVLRTLGFVYRLPSRIVAVSPTIVPQLEAVGVRGCNVTIQPSGVDTEIFFPAQQLPVSPPFQIVVASALIPLKDHPTLFSAMQLLQRDGFDVRLEVAGVGAERERLERLAPRGTQFHGQLERPALGHLLRSCHVAALASVDVATAGEGTPTFLMEAIACGLPFVATDTGGVPRLAAESRAGVVVQQRSPDEFAAALRVLMEDRRAYESFRTAALAFAPSLDWDAVTERLDSVFTGVVSRPEPPTRATGASADRSPDRL